MQLMIFHPYMYGKGGGERHASKVVHPLAEKYDVTVYEFWGIESTRLLEWWSGLEVKKAWECHFKDWYKLIYEASK